MLLGRVANILYQCDDKYAPYMGVSLTSLLESNQEVEVINIYILDGRISEKNKRKILLTGEKYHRNITFLQCDFLDEKLENLGANLYRNSYATFYKVFIFEIIKEKKIELERLLYIDSDTLVIGSIAPLFSIDMEGCPIGMVPDTLAYQYKRKLGFKRNEIYYNAGVVLFDFTNWEAQKWNSKLKTHISQVKADYEKHEQDYFNVVFNKHIYNLNLRYNMQSIHHAASVEQYFRVYHSISYFSKETLKKERNKEVILHFLRFNGEFPWTVNSTHPYAKIFHQFLDISEWKDMNTMDKEHSLIYQIERWMYCHIPRVLFLRIFKLLHDLMHLV